MSEPSEAAKAYIGALMDGLPTREQTNALLADFDRVTEAQFSAILTALDMRLRQNNQAGKR